MAFVQIGTHLKVLFSNYQNKQEPIQPVKMKQKPLKIFQNDAFKCAVLFCDTHTIPNTNWRIAMHNGMLRPEISIESEKVPLDEEKPPIDFIHRNTIPIPDRIIQTQLSEEEEEERIVLNVGGVRHETHISTLRNISDTRLSNLAAQHILSPDTQKDAYFFDRHPAVFNAIIDFYRTGKYFLLNLLEFSQNVWMYQIIQPIMQK